LNILNTDFEYRSVHLVRGGGEHKTKEFASLSPMKAVPALEVDGVVLTESMAIIDYLLETRGAAQGVRLVPSDAVGRAHVRAMVDAIVADIQPIQSMRVMTHVVEMFPGDTAAESQKRRSAWARHWIASGFEGVERMLERHSGAFCYGNALSLADVALEPQVYNAERFAVNLAAFPNILRIHNTLKDLPAFRKAHPAAQPDAEK
jgi:maleylacetoacetate isomerase